MFKDVIVGSGSFLVSVKLMNGTVPLPHNYSLSSDEVVVVDVSLNTTLDQIKLVINRCWATPTQNPGDTYSYTFMENRSAPSHVSLLLLLILLARKTKDQGRCVFQFLVFFSAAVQSTRTPGCSPTGIPAHLVCLCKYSPLLTSA